MEQAAPLSRREHRDGVGRARRTQVGPFQRIDGDVDFSNPRRQGISAFGVRPSHFFADVEHRRFVTFAFADDDRAVDRYRVHDLAHGFHGDLIRLVAVALPHRVSAGDGRLLDDAKEFEREIRIHRRFRSGARSYHARPVTCTGAPRPRPSRLAALAPLAAISRWPVLPTSAHTSPGAMSA